MSLKNIKQTPDQLSDWLIKKIKNPYGDGTAVEKINKVLSNIDTEDKKWYIKKKLC